MLKIFPHPDYVSSDLAHQQKSGAEYSIYKTLSQQLNNGLVIWSCDYLSSDSKDRSVEGECDFIVALPNYGLLFIEVKGGGISYNAETQEWHSEDRHGKIHQINDPFDQARKAKYHLLKKLSQHPNWQNENINRQHIVILPSIKRPNKDFGPDKSLSICLFNEDIDNIVSKLESILIKVNGGEKPSFILGPPILKMIEDILSPSFKIPISFKSSIQIQEQQMINLTSQQLAILQLLKHQKKVGIYGGAGTGKTILGIQKAKEFAEEGLRTLFLCFNRSLSSYLYHSFLSSSPSDQMKDNLLIRHAHDFVSKQSYKYKVPLEKDLINTQGKDKFFNEYYPEVLMSITEKLDNKFDAIVIDEGQDFNDLWWTAFDNLKKDNGYLYVFFDNNQLVQNRSQSEYLNEKNLNLFPLFENFRNSVQIFESMENFYEGMKIISKGPKGKNIKIIEINDIEHQFEETANLVENLFKEGIKPSEIGIINFTKLEKKGIGPLIKQKTNVKVVSSTDRDAWSNEVIMMDSVARFKGLEKNIIIISNINQLEEKKSELYVAMSRAKHMLYVISNNKQIKIFNNLISNKL